MNHKELSREISYILRHAPQDYGLTLDEQGWVGVDALISVLKSQGRFMFLTCDDIEKMIQTSSKMRHQMLNGKIRALYGHSLEKKIKKSPVEPPDVLYHGTARRFVENILAIGLISKDRQYVHLSEDKETALTVGKRRDSTPVIFKVDAKGAWAEGIHFYKENDDIWLADAIPSRFISNL